MEQLAKEAEMVAFWTVELERVNLCDVTKHEDEVIENEILDKYFQ